MSWNIFDIIDGVFNILDLFASDSSPNLDYDKRPQKIQKTKYLPEKIGAFFLLISAILLFLVFKDPLPAENYVQTMVVASLIGLAISLLFFFLLYVLELYYFKNVFLWLFFSCSVIIFSISLVLCVYFKSGLFI